MCRPRAEQMSQFMLVLAKHLLVTIVYASPPVLFFIFAAMAAEGYFAAHERYLYVRRHVK